MMSKMVAIKRFFESEPHGREVRRDELLTLSKDRESYEWMAKECAAALGEELEPAKGA